MIARIARFSFVAAFFALTALPIVPMFLGVMLVKPVDENRRLAPPPQWNWPPKVPILVQQADTWFNDHFGFRSLLIRLKTQIDFSVFRTSDRVHIGSDGWLFYRSVMDREKPNVEEFLRGREDEVLAGFKALDVALRDKGVRLVVTVNLLADRFLADKLPRTIPKLPVPPRMDDFLAKLAGIYGLAYVDATTILRRTQAFRPVFHKTDFHWNDPGAFEVARELVERMAQLEARSEPVWKHSLQIETRRGSGGIAMFMPLFFPPSEEHLLVKQTWTDPPGLTHFFKEGIYEGGFHVTVPDRQLLPTVVVVGDSYFDGIMRSGFGAYFRNLHRARWNGTLKLSEVAAALPPDTRYLVIQFIEVSYTVLLRFADQADVALAVERIAARPTPTRSIR